MEIENLLVVGPELKKIDNRGTYRLKYLTKELRGIVLLIYLFLSIGFYTIAQKNGTGKMLDGKYYPTVFIDELEHIIKDGDTTRLIRETMPEFPGGESGLIKYLSQNMKYPKSARKEKVQGKVIVKFIINVDGRVDSVEVESGIRQDLDQSAVELIKEMPRWKPGTQDEKPVIVHYMIPIIFRL